MSSGNGATRWWEGYLVRYFMPSIAGVVIILWLSSVAGDEFRNLLLISKDIDHLDSSNLILLFLYANLFCYIASYPILSFHATRVLDFTEDRWPNHWWADGYIWSFFLGIIAFIIAMFAGSTAAFFLVYFVVTIFVGVQIGRIIWGLMAKQTYDGLGEEASPLFAYAYALAKRRSVVEEITENTEGDGSNSAKGKTRTIRWRPEFMDTYRHMREHGNSAFIFYLELSLAALVYVLVAIPGHSALYQLSAIGVLFALWALPAVFVHLTGQHLERRFSQFNRRLIQKSNDPTGAALTTTKTNVNRTHDSG